VSVTSDAAFVADTPTELTPASVAPTGTATPIVDPITVSSVTVITTARETFRLDMYSIL